MTEFEKEVAVWFSQLCPTAPDWVASEAPRQVRAIRQKLLPETYDYTPLQLVVLWIVFRTTHMDEVTLPKRQRAALMLWLARFLRTPADALRTRGA